MEIFKTIFSSFFKQIGKILAYVLLFIVIGLLATKCEKVHAVAGWGGYIGQYSDYWLTRSLSPNANIVYPSDTLVADGVYSAQRFADTGTSTYFYINENIPKIIKNHYYSYSQLICSNSNISAMGDDLNVYFNLSSTSYTYNKSMSVVPISPMANNSSVYKYCYKFTAEFNTNSTLTNGENTIISLRYTGGSSKNIYVWGSILDDRGLSNTFVESITGQLNDISNNVNNINNNDVINGLNNMENNIINNQNVNNQIIINNQNSNNNILLSNQNSNNNLLMSNENKNHEEAEKTRKGILGKIGDIFNKIGELLKTLVELPGKLVSLLIDALMNLLKELFIPSDDFFKNFFDEFLDYLKQKLGFLAYPFTLVIDVLNRYLDIEPQPLDITIPSFKMPIFNVVLWEEYTLSFEQLFFNYPILKKLHDLTITFTSALLSLCLMKACYNAYNEFLGISRSEIDTHIPKNVYSYSAKGSDKK